MEFSVWVQHNYYYKQQQQQNLEIRQSNMITSRVSTQTVQNIQDTTPKNFKYKETRKYNSFLREKTINRDLPLRWPTCWI